MKRAIKQPIPFVGTPVIRYYARCFIYFLIFKTMPQKTQILTIFYIIEKIVYVKTLCNLTNVNK